MSYVTFGLIVAFLIAVFFEYLKYRQSLLSDFRKRSRILAKRILIFGVSGLILNFALRFVTPDGSPASKEDLKKTANWIISELRGNFVYSLPGKEEVRDEVTREAQISLEKLKCEFLNNYSLGEKSYKKGNYKSAIQYFQLSLECLKTPSAFFALGNCFYATGDYENALEYFSNCNRCCGDVLLTDARIG